MRIVKMALLVTLIALLTGCASTRLARPAPPTLDEIVEMSKAGTSSEEIIKRLKESRAIYTLSASQIASLHDRGVSDTVLDYMHSVYLREVREDEAAQAYHRYGWRFQPYFFYGFPHGHGRGRWRGGIHYGW